MNYYSLLNAPVISFPTGRKIGELSDVLLLDNSTLIFGVIATNRSLIYSNRLFKTSDILYMSKDTVTVSGLGERFVKIPKAEGSISFKKAIENNALSDRKHKIIGMVKDGYFDMETGSLTELLVGGSIADDLIHGRRLVRCDSLSLKDGSLTAENPVEFEGSRELRRLLED
ncbi:MAG: hypothetical protein Q8882_07875 [Bacillota bacterium]|nr:hypothetical protein [Bacillota bacterium]